LKIFSVSVQLSVFQIIHISLLVSVSINEYITGGDFEIYSLTDREPVEIGKELRCGD